MSVSLAIYGSGCTKKVSTCFGRTKNLPLLIQKRHRKVQDYMQDFNFGQEVVGLKGKQAGGEGLI